MSGGLDEVKIKWWRGSSLHALPGLAVEEDAEATGRRRRIELETRTRLYGCSAPRHDGGKGGGQLYAPAVYGRSSVEKSRREGGALCWI